MWFPLFHTTLSKVPFEENLTWKFLEWIYTCNEPTKPNDPGVHKQLGSLKGLRGPRVPGKKQGSRGSTVPFFYNTSYIRFYLYSNQAF